MTNEDKNKFFAECCGKIKDKHGLIHFHEKLMLRQMFDLVIEKIEKLEFSVKYGNGEFQKLLQENEDLKNDIEARKFAMAMSERVEKELREQIEKMKCCGNCKSNTEDGCETTEDYCIDKSAWEMKE